MNKINYFVHYCSLAISLLILSILSSLKYSLTISWIANVVFLIFICLYISCSFKLHLIDIVCSIGLLIYYLTDIYNTGSEGHFSKSTVALIVCIVLAISISSLICTINALIYAPYGKEKAKSVLNIVLVIVAAGIWMLGLFYSVLEPGVISYIVNVIATLIFVFINAIVTRFNLFKILSN